MGRKGTAAIGRWTVALLPSGIVLLAGVGKFMDTARWEADFVGWGLPAALVPVIGALEILAAVAMIVPKTRCYGAALLVAVMLGAAGTHLANAEWLHTFGPLVIAAVAALSGWWARPLWLDRMVFKEPAAPQAPGSRRR